MATVLLSNAGAALGAGLFGPVGGILGRAAGALAGAALDQRLFGKDQVVRGPRLEDARIMASSDGASMPRVYGRARLGGQLVWAARFEEVTSEQQQGGKGAPATTVSTAAYFASFAIAICEGPISHVSRIWADGKEIDRTRNEIRIYPGDEDQEPDPLIEARQGANNAPAFRGTAYVVFEAYPLEAHGNRIPQFSFEVIRSVARLDKSIKAVTLIPGASEFGLSPVGVESAGSSGTRIINRNTTTHATDFEASLDELQALCPDLASVALVVSWFGSDLRAGECKVEPRVEFNSAGAAWRVSGIARSQAGEVSRFDGRPAYGGSPSDNAVLAAIAALKARGLKVLLYPFLLMDIPLANALPDPHGGTTQPAFPWRGTITCHPARDAIGSVDGTPAARAQAEAFAGSLSASAFQPAGDSIACTSSEWSWRRMVLHYAHLAVLAGGIDAFLIGSEFVGLTTLRDETGAFPFVDALVALAADTSTVLGPQTALSYGADWSEYFGYHPQDGSDDLLYHLDPLWAHSAISAVGIDNYMPLADWRAGGDPGNANAASQFDLQYLTQNITGGEGFDWHYASPADRFAAARTLITDGQGEPWVWRNKDIASWWANPHHERKNGVRSHDPTAWVPQSKPVWFTELGCGAVTMGANQPNVFADAKSAQSGLPHFSTGARCDLAQNRFLQAHLDHWAGLQNPVSPLYGGPMVDPANIHLWAWDARPFPQFPANSQVWSDAANWQTGHWLNGRLGACPLDDLLIAIAADHGVEALAKCDGFLDGYVIPGPASARAALEPLAGAFGLDADDATGAIRFAARAYAPVVTIASGEFVDPQQGPLLRHAREQESELPQSAEMSHADLFSDYEPGHSYSRRLQTGSRRTVSLQLPAIMPVASATGLLEARLRDTWIAREQLSVSLPARYAALETGDQLQFAGGPPGRWRIESIEDGKDRALSLRATAKFDELPAPLAAGSMPVLGRFAFGKPHLLLMNLPFAVSGGAPALRCAIDAEPWAGNYGLWSSPGENGFALRRSLARRAVTGELMTPLAPGPQGRWDRANTIHLRLRRGLLSSATDALLLNGTNAAAVQCGNGEWEIVQFASAQLLQDGTWRLSRLLRAQQGTDGAMAAGAQSGSQFVLLNDAVESVQLASGESGLTLNWRAGPVGDPVASPAHVMLSHAHLPLDKRPLSPVHLSAVRQADDDIALNWIRRSRIDADGWDGAEIVLGESVERYGVAIVSGSGTVLRSLQAPTTSAAYPASEQIADFGSLPGQIAFRVAQIGDAGLLGTWAQADIQLM